MNPVAEILAQLEALGNETVRAINRRRGVNGDQYGVLMGDLRALAKRIKSNHPLGTALWETGNLDAQLLGILLMKPKALSNAQLEGLVRSVVHVPVADWFNSYILKKHPAKEDFREAWMDDPSPMVVRAGWSLTADRVQKAPEGLDLPGLLDRIEAELSAAPAPVQWTMNMTLAQIGIHHPTQRGRALAIGEAMGVYRDYPVSKGCTSPFAPIWISAMVARQG